MKVQLIFFTGCPHVELARDLLRRAGVPFEDVDTSSPSSPADLRNWGSPTILVDGRDVAGGLPGGGSACRIYEGGAAIPTETQLRRALSRAP